MADNLDPVVQPPTAAITPVSDPVVDPTTRQTAAPNVLAQDVAATPLPSDKGMVANRLNAAGEGILSTAFGTVAPALIDSMDWVGRKVGAVQDETPGTQSNYEYMRPIREAEARRANALSELNSSRDAQSVFGAKAGPVVGGLGQSLTEGTLMGLGGTAAIAAHFGAQGHDKAVVRALDAGLTRPEAETHGQIQGAIDAALPLVGGAIASKLGAAGGETLMPEAAYVADKVAERTGLKRVLVSAALEGGENTLQQLATIGEDLRSGTDPHASDNIAEKLITAFAGGTVGGAISPVHEIVRNKVYDFVEAMPLYMKGREAAQTYKGTAEDVLAAETQKEFEAATGIKKASKHFRDGYKDTIVEAAAPPEDTATPTPESVVPPPGSEPPVETTVPAEDGTSVKHAYIDRDRELMDLVEVPFDGQLGFKAALNSARAKGLPDRALDLSTELLAKPRAMTPEESAGVTIRMRDLKDQYANVEAMLKATTDPADVISLGSHLDRLEQEFDTVSAAARKSGSLRGQALAFQKLVLNKDDSVLATLQRAKVAAGGELNATAKRNLSENAAKKIKAREELEKFDAETDALPPEKPMEGDISTVRNEAKSVVDKAAAVNGMAEELRALATLAKTNDPEFKTRLADLEARIKTAAENGVDTSVAQEVIDKAENLTKTNNDQAVNALDKVLGKLGAFHTNEVARSAKQATSLDDIAKQLDRLANGAKNKDKKLPEKRLSRLEEITDLRQKIMSEDLTDAQRVGSLRAVDKLEQYYKSTDRNNYIAQAEKFKGGKLTAEERQQVSNFYDALSDPDKIKALRVSRGKQREDLQFTNDSLAKDIQSQINSLKPKDLWGHIKEPFHLMRALKTSFDMSSVLRQGGFIALGRPGLAIKSLIGALPAIKSERDAYAIDKEIQARPNAPLYEKSDLYLHRDDKITAREESYMSKWAEKIPGLAASQRFHTTFLNKLRADTFDHLMATLTKNGTPTDAEARAVANYINVATGRGGHGSMESAMEGMSTLMFAPRYVLSRFQLAMGQPFLRGESSAVRKQIAKEYARYLTGVATVYGLSYMGWGDRKDFAISFDPNSSDFGKVRVGPRSILDPLSGLSQTMRLMWFIGNGSAKTISNVAGQATGNKALTDFGKQPFGQDALTKTERFIRTKLAPMPGFIGDLMSGKDVTGQPITVAGSTIGQFAPLAPNDIRQAFKEEGVTSATALSILSNLGMGVQFYGLPDEVRMEFGNDGRYITGTDGTRLAGPFKDKGDVQHWLKSHKYVGFEKQGK